MVKSVETVCSNSCNMEADGARTMMLRQTLYRHFLQLSVEFIMLHKWFRSSCNPSLEESLWISQLLVWRWCQSNSSDCVHKQLLFTFTREAKHVRCLFDVDQQTCEHSLPHHSEHLWTWSKCSEPRRVLSALEIKNIGERSYRVFEQELDKSLSCLKSPEKEVLHQINFNDAMILYRKWDIFYQGVTVLYQRHDITLHFILKVNTFNNLYNNNTTLLHFRGKCSFTLHCIWYIVDINGSTVIMQ